MKNKLIIFDLDGVLINSLSNMEYSWNQVRKKCKIKKNFNAYKKLIGLEFYEILTRLKIKKNIQPKVKKIYSKSSINDLNRIHLYPDVHKILVKLQKKFKLAILTSKDAVRTKQILKKLLPKIKFSSIQSPQKNFRPKPFSDLMLKVISENNTDLKDVIFIGDSKYDMQMAKSSNVKFLFASYGYSKTKNLYSKKITKFKEIIKLIK